MNHDKYVTTPARHLIGGQIVADTERTQPVFNPATGQFAADMQVHLDNDGPVTIPLRMAPAAHQN